MAFFQVKTDEENVKDYQGGSNYLNKSGMYDIIIKNIIVETTPKGSQYINLFLNYKGQDQVFYQAMRLTNNDGGANLGQQLFNKLMIVLGVKESDVIEDPVLVKLPVGKGGEMKDCMVLEQFTECPVTVRVQMEYGMYEGKIQERRNIRNVFDITNHATAAEIVNKVENPGSQYEKELEFADKVTYKDDLTEADVEAWIKSKKSGNKDSEEKKPASFGQKRSFGRK